MLRAGHLCSPLEIPILGINLGKFGFLMELQRQRWQELLPRLIEGNYRLEKRMTLQASHKRGDELLGTWQVINEAVVSRGQVVRPIRLKAHVDGYSLATFCGRWFDCCNCYRLDRLLAGSRRPDHAARAA